MDANTVVQISDADEKKKIAREILEALPDWFGIPEAREEYIIASAEQPFFAVMEETGTTAVCPEQQASPRPLGFLCLKETGKDTAELAVMGVRKEFHRHGLGRKLFFAAKEYAAGQGYSFMQVKTVRMGRYPDYDDTNRFYLSLGFKEFEVFPTLWDEWNPCQVYVMGL